MTSAKTRVVDLEELRAQHNGRTRIAPLLADELCFVPEEELRERWQEILERVHAWRAEHPEGNALAVVLRHDAHFDVVLHQVVDEPVAVVVGRHSACDLVLQAAHASLRHAVIIAWPHAEGRVVAIDLRSELGLTTDDRRMASRVSSATALRFHAAAAEVTALFAARDAPFAARWADQLDAQLSGALVEDDRSAKIRAGDPAAGFVDSWERSVVVRTRVIGMPPPVIREDQLAVAATRGSVERGVVLGRYARCERTTAIADDDRVSRVHALVFAAGGALWVVDTASTHGTTLVSPGRTPSRVDVGEGRRIARLRHDARLYLAGIEVVLVLDPAPDP